MEKCDGFYVFVLLLFCYGYGYFGRWLDEFIEVNDFYEDCGIVLISWWIRVENFDLI